MDGFQRIADQNHILVIPVSASDEFRVEPQRPVGDQRRALEEIPEDIGAQRSALFVTRTIKSSLSPSFRAALDHKRSELGREAVAVGDERAEFGVLKDQSDRTQSFWRRIPDPLVKPGFFGGAEMVVKSGAHRAVDPVSPDDEIVSLKQRRVCDARTEIDLNAFVCGVFLHELQQLHSGDAHEAVAFEGDFHTFVNDGDTILEFRNVGDLSPQTGIDAVQYVEGDVGEHDAETVSRIGRILLEDLNRVSGLSLLHRFS